MYTYVYWKVYATNTENRRLKGSATPEVAQKVIGVQKLNAAKADEDLSDCSRKNLSGLYYVQYI